MTVVINKLTQCPSCGHNVSRNAMACPNCGEPLTRNAKNVNEAKGIIATAAIWTLRIVGSFLLLLIALFVWFAYIEEPNDPSTHSGNSTAQVPHANSGSNSGLSLESNPAITAWKNDSTTASDTRDAPDPADAVAANRDSPTRRNMNAVIDALRSNYKIEANLKYASIREVCQHDKFCEVYADSVQIQAVGFIVQALSSSNVTPAFYQSVCSGALIGLGNVNKDLAESTVRQMFDSASYSGKSRAKVGGVEITVEPATSNSLLECEFFKR